MDSFIGKPFYSNAAGALLDPTTGLEAPSTAFRAEQVPTNSIEQVPSTPAYNMEAEVFDAGDATARIEMMRAKRLADAQRIAQIEAEKQASLNNPIIVIPPSYVAPPLIVGGGGGGGSIGGGGGGAMSGMPPISSSTVVAKPSFLKKNFIPLLLVVSAIYVFIKKPIK
jgi:hypothetical protein